MRNAALQIECPLCGALAGAECTGEMPNAYTTVHNERAEKQRAADWKLDLLVTKALGFAAHAHAGQLDKAGVPYILHPLAVFDAVKGEGRVTKIIALLHDVVEDTPVTLDEIRAEFGDEVADGVASVSRGYILPTGEMVFKQPEGPHTKELYRHFVERSKRNKRGRRVKIADIEHNSLPERLSFLPKDEQEMLHTRYIPALEFLRHPTKTEFPPVKKGKK
jgi:(p)ppGpp synthase/HD superfamily hydrolase